MKPPSVTHYSLFEGGPWYPWAPNVPTAPNVFAIRLADGWVWDILVGWRRPAEEIV